MPTTQTGPARRQRPARPVLTDPEYLRRAYMMSTYTNADHAREVLQKLERTSGGGGNVSRNMSGYLFRCMAVKNRYFIDPADHTRLVKGFDLHWETVEGQPDLDGQQRARLFDCLCVLVPGLSVPDMVFNHHTVSLRLPITVPMPLDNNPSYPYMDLTMASAAQLTKLLGVMQWLHKLKRQELPSADAARERAWMSSVWEKKERNKLYERKRKELLAENDVKNYWQISREATNWANAQSIGLPPDDLSFDKICGRRIFR
jgi:hypothetical protein